MIDFIQLQQRLKERLGQDRSIHLIEAEGSTLEAAVSEAAVLLDIPVKYLEYEVLERGSSGFWGVGRKDWKIRAYERAVEETQEENADEAEFEGFAETFKPAVTDKNGEIFVLLTSEGAMLKVTPPVGKGKRATDAQAMMLLNNRTAREIDEELVKTVVREADGEYVRVGAFAHNLANDSSARVEIVENNMKALLTVTAPGPGGFDLDYDYYISLIKQNRVYYGIKEDFLRDFVDHSVYREAVVIAEGVKPVNGRDAFIQYNFETGKEKVKITEGADGRVDFKNINIIRNVVEGQPLAKKIVAEQGVPGKNLSGEMLPAIDGRDIPMPTGKNVKVAEDGETIIAETSGQVLLVGDKINVEPVYYVKGNVNLGTGNIDFLGSVVVSGNVEDGFSIKAAGNIEIHGTVEKANLRAVGDIAVYQGITGKGTALIRAGRSIWARFIENTMVEAGNMVVVSDGIVNSQVDAFQRIIVKGKRAHIVGGRLRATEEINADSIGSATSGTETICEVGYDLKAKLRHDGLVEKKTALEEELIVLQRDLQILINIQKQRKTLPEDKEIEMKEMIKKRQSLMNTIRELNTEKQKLEDLLEGSPCTGKVSAASKVFPGVRIIIRDMKEDIRTDYKAVTFFMENGLIRVTKYEEPDEEGLEMPSGNTTD
ncbi:MAG: FapA family protein [Treponema sp.]|nr:FapA family protein [Treponema sp.]